jgi:hypothetical protein
VRDREGRRRRTRQNLLWRGCAILATSALIVLGMAAPASAAGTTWYVDGSNGGFGPGCGQTAGSGACASVGQALRNARAGDTISIAAGIYVESPLKITKSVTLRGDRTDGVRLQEHRGASEPTVSIGASLPIAVDITDMTIESGLYGSSAVQVGAASYVALTDVTVSPSLDASAVAASGIVVLGGSTLEMTRSTSSGFAVTGLMIQDATATLTDSAFAHSGIGVYVLSGDVSVTGGSVTGNHYAGLRTEEPDVAVDLTGTSITGNGMATVGPFAGGIVMQSGAVTAGEATISGNLVGAVLASGTLSFTDSVVRGNGNGSGRASTTSGFGIAALGALAGQDSTAPRVWLSRTEVSGNSRGIALSGARAQVSESTIAGNASAGIVTGGTPAPSELSLTSSTIADNGTVNPGTPGPSAGLVMQSRSRIVVGGSIVDGAAEAPACTFAPDSHAPGVLDDGGFNVASDASCGFSQHTSMSATDPQLGALADNGGSTRTMALAAHSPAADLIFAGAQLQVPRGIRVTERDLCAAGSIDQRGTTRPHGAGCEAGAVEIQALAPAGAVITPACAHALWHPN